ncbi:unnamed protein product [Meloidogyne enterolobii]|uniref:Uncharacterized protein n=1 Tax=Meloidogyne enterolobii TaxID=390850 RepID=A0ACB0Y6A5_MELEN
MYKANFSGSLGDTEKILPIRGLRFLFFSLIFNFFQTLSFVLNAYVSGMFSKRIFLTAESLSHNFQ